MRIVKAVILTTALFFGGCNKIPPPISSVPSPAPEFEIRDFVVKEETEFKYENRRLFTGTGILTARNVGADKNLLVYLEVRNKTKGANSKPRIEAVFFRGGIGQINVSEYDTIDKRPDYEWSVIGWQELNKATIQTAIP